MTNNPPLNRGGLQGTPPMIFTGDRARSDTFWNEVRRYKLLNRHNEAISNPFNRVLTVLSYIKGDRVEDWVDGKAQKLEDRINTSRANHVKDTDEVLWQEFEAAFKAVWKDGAKTQSTYDQLKKLTMKDLDVDAYIATFNQLALAAGWEADALGMIDTFADGLKDNVHHRVLNREMEPTMMEEWQDAARKETQKFRKLSSAGLDFRSKNKSRDTGPFHTGQNPRPTPPHPNTSQIVPMDVDTTSVQTCAPFKKLTDEEWLQHMQEGRCFRCRLKGHMARECLTRNTRTSNASPLANSCARNIDTTSGDEQTDKPKTTTAVVRTVTNAPTLTQAQQIAAIKEEMSDEERTTYLDSQDMEADFCSVEF